MRIKDKGKLNRREFFKISTITGLGLSFAGPNTLLAQNLKNKMKLGLVTYQWGKDWDLETIIKNCQASGLSGVELRTQHAHKVEPVLSALERREVKKKFANSKITCVGYGSNQEFHSSDPKIVRQQIEGTFELIKLCHDIGASGVKVKPNGLPPDVPKEKTIEQIGRSLNEIGRYARDYGQLIRVEVHGQQTQEIPNMKAIFDYVDQPNVKICWNSNPPDLQPPGLEANFETLKKWIGDTVHIRALDSKIYPFQTLMGLLSKADFTGWLLIEETSTPPDTVAEMARQQKIFNEMLTKI